MTLYATRTKSGILKGFNNEPKYDKYKDMWFCFKSGFGLDTDFGIFMGDLFPEITFENSPKQVEIKLIDDVFESLLIPINYENVSVGDYICIECERFEDDAIYLKIVDVQQRFDTITGEPILIVTDEENKIWSTKTGRCLSDPNSFYEIIGIFRKKQQIF